MTQTLSEPAEGLTAGLEFRGAELAASTSPSGSSS